MRRRLLRVVRQVGFVRFSVLLLAIAVMIAGCVLRPAPRAGTPHMPPLIPRELVFGNPEKVSPDLSPDGQRLAYIAPDQGVLNVWVKTVGKNDDQVITKDRRRGIHAYFWAPNGQQIVYVQDKDGDENWHVYAVPASGGDPVDLTPFPKVQARILGVEPRFPDEILVGLNNRVPQLHDIYRLDLKTRALTLEAKNDLNAAALIPDHELRVRLALIATPDGGSKLLHRAAPNAEWNQVLAWGSEDATTTYPAGFAADNQTLYMLSSIGSNAAEVRTRDLATGKEQVVASDPTYDASGLAVHPTTYQIQAVAFTAERRRWKVIDPAVQADFDELAKLHYGDFSIVSRNLADTAWLVGYTQDKGPYVYYAYDRATKKGTFLFSARPKLEKVALAEMKPIQFTSRDGLTIHGYLSLPVGLEPKNLPAVLDVHGGPWARDTWGYSGEVQWLANRGYACLQVNFRGSTGYGKAFVNAGDREWGAKMQDDLTDAVKWLVAQGIADPKRIGIYGASYGGYAVLAGLTTTPDLYACGVDMVGPSNLITFLSTVPPYWEPLRARLRKRVGDLEKDQEFLKSRSPLFHTGRIRAPLFIAQGANDPRVKRAESIQIRDAVQAAGKTVEYLEFADEGHGFARPQNRLKFYAAAERFLAKHLGGRFEPE